MKYFLIIAIMIIGSCKQKSTSKNDEEAKLDMEVKVKKIAAPMIADQIGDLDILFSKVTNEKLPCYYRQKALQEIENKYPEFLSNYRFNYELGIPREKETDKNLETDIKNIGNPNYCTPPILILLDTVTHSQRFKGAIARQKNFIEKKCMAEASEIIYKQSLRKKYEGEASKN